MEPLKRSLLLLFAIHSIFSFTEAARADVVSTPEAAYFEQTYETWARTIIQGIEPKLKFTVLTKVEFTQNPERIAVYEDLKIATHLPGLPDVQDPNYNNPMESPLYALVSHRAIKIIFYSFLSPVQERVLKEVLMAKLKLSPGDSLTMELLGNAEETGKKSVPAPYRAAVLSLFGILLLTFAFKKSIFSKATNRTAPAANTPPPYDRSSRAIQEILKVNPLVLRNTLSLERAEVIAKATMHTTRGLADLILQECSPQQLQSVKQWIRDHGSKVKHTDSAYSRLLLAARIQQNQTSLVLKSIDRFHEMKRMKSDLQQNLSQAAGNRSNEVAL